MKLEDKKYDYTKERKLFLTLIPYVCDLPFSSSLSFKQYRFPCGHERKPMEQEESFPETDGTQHLTLIAYVRKEEVEEKK